MKCRVLLFAQLADAVGRREIEIDLPDGATVGGTLDVLVQKHNVLTSMRNRIAVAVNEQYSSSDRTLSEGDVVALIPPVSGR